MRRITPRWIPALLLVAAGIVGTGATAHASTSQPSDDIVGRLKAIPGMTVVSDQVLPKLPGYRYYDLEFKQAVDHRHPNKGTFEQRIRLLHKSVDRPMVLFDTGYDLYTAPEFLSEPTKILDADQVDVEQRFFTPSRPTPANWSDLNIWQAATDHHTVVQALKTIYHGKWISTGASKGGMTAVYHRRFYPNDVDATVAYVAPDNTNVKDNRAYDYFFNHVGTAKCRAQLAGLQQEALNRRPAMLKLMKAEWKAKNLHVTVLKTIDRAYEASVIDFRWAFWQFHLAAECKDIPARTASTATIYSYIDGVEDFTSNSDEVLAEFVPYYYQAATQLAAPYPSFKYLKGLRYPGIYAAREYVPSSIHIGAFDYRAMPDIDNWVRNDSSRMMFLYGGNDPWGAKPFRLGKGTTDSYWYSVAGQPHSQTLISVLPQPQRDQAVGALLRWAGEWHNQALPNVIAPAPSADPLLTKRPPL